jgi:hypothetical protein
MTRRADMPLVALFVDRLREAFGTECVNDWLRGQDGAHFCAQENGVRWCTPGRMCDQCKEEKRGRWE